MQNSPKYKPIRDVLRLILNPLCPVICSNGGDTNRVLLSRAQPWIDFSSVRMLHELENETVINNMEKKLQSTRERYVASVTVDKYSIKSLTKTEGTGGSIKYIATSTAPAAYAAEEDKNYAATTAAAAITSFDYHLHRHHYKTLSQRFSELRPWFCDHQRISQSDSLLLTINNCYRLSSLFLDPTGHWNQRFEVVPFWAFIADKLERTSSSLISRYVRIICI